MGAHPLCAGSNPVVRSKRIVLVRRRVNELTH